VRITHIITRLIVGGAQENTVASVLGLRRRADLMVRLISGPTTGPEGSLESSFEEAPEILSIVPQLVRPIRPWKDWQALRQLTQLLRSHRPALVHTHSGKAGILGRLAARRAQVPLVVHTIHGPSFGAFQNPFTNRIFRSAERRAAACTTHFVSVAEAMTEQYLAAGIGRPEQFTCIRSGFSLPPFLSVKSDPDFRARLQIAPSDFVVGMIARLCELKGHDDLIASAPAVVKRNPRTKFLLVGGGPWRDRLQARVQELRLHDHFVFAGLVPPAEIPHYLGAMDVLAHLSRREGLARALPQALAAGRPVVAYDCDGAKEICLPDQTGYLIPPGDLHQLAERILQLAADPALRKRLGKQGQQLVKHRFSVEQMVEELYLLYRRLDAQRK